jgi:hypothetical protein
MRAAAKTAAFFLSTSLGYLQCDKLIALLTKSFDFFTTFEGQRTEYRL